MKNYYANREELLAKQKEYKEKNPHVVKEWRARNKEHILNYNRMYNSQEHIKVINRLKEHNRRVRKYAQEGALTYDEVDKLLTTSRS